MPVLFSGVMSFLSRGVIGQFSAGEMNAQLAAGNASDAVDLVISVSEYVICDAFERGEIYLHSIRFSFIIYIRYLFYHEHQRTMI